MTLDASQPRQFGPGAGSDRTGLPRACGARITARRNFVALKLDFLRALEGTSASEWLHRQVRCAEEPMDLWLLRAPVLALLNEPDGRHRTRRQALRRGLDSVFPALDTPSAFTSF